jgi:hypothetical protein
MPGKGTKKKGAAPAHKPFFGTASAAAAAAALKFAEIAQTEAMKAAAQAALLAPAPQFGPKNGPPPYPGQSSAEAAAAAAASASSSNSLESSGSSSSSSSLESSGSSSSSSSGSNLTVADTVGTVTTVTLMDSTKPKLTTGKKMDLGILQEVENYKIFGLADNSCAFMKPISQLLSERASSSYLKVRPITTARLRTWYEEFKLYGFIGSTSICVKQHRSKSGAIELWIFVSSAFCRCFVGCTFP